MTFLTAWIAPALVALLPAASYFWWTRPLKSLAADPALPERLVAVRARTVRILAGAFAAIVIAWPQDFFWCFPLLIYGRVAAAHPIRRALLGETWTIGAYLWFFTRVVVALFGFWLLLLWTPHLVTLGGTHETIAAATLGAILLAWSWKNVDVVRFCLGTKPIADAALASRFAALADAAGVPQPRFEVIPLAGGAIANAIALPARTRAAVLFTARLIAFEPDESAAVCAHELAHLEYYDRRRVSRLNAVTVSLVVASISIAPILHLLTPASLWTASYVWPVVIVWTLVLRARHRQKHETVSDLRAVELTGDPDALIRALTRIHAIAKIPRRWDSRVERQATHPSLARRIQAIRDASGTNRPAVETPIVIGLAEGGSLTFHADRLQWNETELTSHTVSYAALTELRVSAQRAQAMQVIAVEKSGRRWSIPLAPDAVGRVQSALDAIDTRLAPPAPPPAFSHTIARVAAAMTAIVALPLTQFAVVFSALLAFVRPGSPVTAAAGLASLATAGLMWFDGVSSMNVEAIDSVVAAALALCGVLLLLVARANRRDKAEPSSRMALAALGVLTILAWAGALNGVDSVVRLHQHARTWPSATILSLAFGAGLIWARGRVARAGVPMLLAGIVLGLTGTPAFLNAFGTDPFLAPAVDRTPVRTIAGRTLREFPLPYAVTNIELSPRGRSIAVSSEDQDERITVHVGPTGGLLASIDAETVAFVDDTRLLAITHDDERSVLRLMAIDESVHVIWERTLQRIYRAQLSVASDARSWNVLGSSRDDTIVHAHGGFDAEPPQERRWKLPRPGRGWISALIAEGDEPVAIELLYDGMPLESSRWWMLAPWLISAHTETSRFWRLTPSGPVDIGISLLKPGCVAEPNAAPICAAFDGNRTRFFAIDAGAHRFLPLTAIAGHIVPYGTARSGWVHGLWDNKPAAFRIDPHEIVRLAVAGEERAARLLVAEHAVLSVVWRGDHSTVRIHEVD